MSDGHVRKARVVGVYYDTDQLRQMPKAQQKIYLGCCQMINELGILAKQMLFAFNGRDHADLPIRLAQDAMGFLNMRLLAGRLVESYEFIKQNQKLIKSLIDTDFYADFDKDFLKLANLVGSSSTAIKKIRNRAAFHSNVKFLHEQFQRHPKDEFVEFFSEERGSMLFHGAELITLNVAIDAFRSDGGVDELHALQKEIMEAMGATIEIGQQTAGSIFAKFCGDAETMKKKYWEVEMPDLKNVITPFFTAVAPETDVKL